MARLSRRLQRHGVALVLTAALLARLWGLNFGLPGLAVTDEGSDIAASLRLARAEWNSGRDFHRVLLPLVELPFFAAYYVGLRAAGAVHTLSEFRDLYFADRSGFTLIARLLSVTSGVGAVGLVYAIGRRLGDAWTGLMAGGLLAVNFFHSYYSHVAIPDVMASTFGLLTIWCALEVMRSGSTRAYVAMGACASLTLLAKVNAIFVAAPVALIALAGAWRDRGLRQAGRGAAAALVAGLIALPLFNPLIVLRPAGVWADIQDLFGRIYVGHSVSSPPPWLLNLQTLLLMGGWPLLATALAGLFVSFARPTRERLALGLASTAFALVVARTGSLNPNYWLPLIPLAALSAALAISSLMARLGYERLAWPVGLLSLALIAWEALPTIQTDVLLARPDTRQLAVADLQRLLPPGAAILMGDPFVYSMPLWRNERSISRLAAMTGTTLDTYQWWLDRPADARPGPSYDLYGPEFNGQVSDETVIAFAAEHQIEYVIQTDYCTGEAASPSVIGFPHIPA
ncbi:MAG: glycosyltransferase family 39 protein, partial [Chloroflexi bacterium]|nr:glycosyltransferase family 39 protein [Chloroflexota bacterium]